MEVKLPIRRSALNLTARHRLLLDFTRSRSDQIKVDPWRIESSTDLDPTRQPNNLTKNVRLQLVGLSIGSELGRVVSSKSQSLAIGSFPDLGSVSSAKLLN